MHITVIFTTKCVAPTLKCDDKKPSDITHRLNYSWYTSSRQLFRTSGYQQKGKTLLKALNGEETGSPWNKSTNCKIDLFNSSAMDPTKGWLFGIPWKSEFWLLLSLTYWQSNTFQISFSFIVQTWHTWNLCNKLTTTHILFQWSRYS